MTPYPNLTKETLAKSQISGDNQMIVNDYVKKASGNPQLIGKWGAPRIPNANEPVALGYFGSKKKKGRK